MKTRDGIKKCFLWVCLLLVLITGIDQIHKKNLGRDIDALNIDAVLPSVRLIAAGEATHGNRETALVWKELLVQLVEEYGCRAFILETSFGDTEKINEYLLNDSGTAEECVFQIDAGPYRTEEMVDLLQWIHDYNLLVEDHERIRFYGIDIQRNIDSKEALLAYIQRAEPKHVSAYYPMLGQNKPHERADTELSAADVATGMENNKSLYIERTSEQEYMLAKRHADCILMTEDLLLAEGEAQSTLRDRYMAENVLWILEHEAAYYQNSHALLGAHNGHILRQSNSPLAYEKPMGQYLGEALGSDYYPIGLETGENTFWAWKRRIPWAYHVEREGWLIDLLNDASGQAAFVDLSDYNDPNAAAIRGQDWNITGIGSVYRQIQSLYPESSGLPVRLDAAYSAILFLPTATPSALMGSNNITMILLVSVFGFLCWRVMRKKRRCPISRKPHR